MSTGARRLRPEVAARRIASFRTRFGEEHLFLAWHAAFPLTLTPDLLYHLWASFQTDVEGRLLRVPWVAVADLLLSGLCNEVGHDVEEMHLFEMDLGVRAALLGALEVDPRFGPRRLRELSAFLDEYVSHQAYARAPESDLATSQRWTALAYVQPGKAVRELAEAFAKAGLEDRPELVRIASIVEALEPALPGFTPLVEYAKGMTAFARNDLTGAASHLGAVADVNVAGIKLPFPPSVSSTATTEAASTPVVEGVPATPTEIAAEDSGPGVPEDPLLAMENHLLRDWLPALGDTEEHGLPLGAALEALFRSVMPTMRPTLQWFDVIERYSNDPALPPHLPKEEEDAIRKLRNLGLLRHDGEWLFTPTRSTALDVTAAGALLFALRGRGTTAPTRVAHDFVGGLAALDGAALGLLDTVEKTGRIPSGQKGQKEQVRRLRNQCLVTHAEHFLADSDKAALTELGSYVLRWHPEAPGVTLDELAALGFVTELGAIFLNEAEARHLFRVAQIPLNRMPTFEKLAPAIFWDQVCQILAGGIVEHGLVALVLAAVQEYPGNTIFKEAAACVRAPIAPIASPAPAAASAPAAPPTATAVSQLGGMLGSQPPGTSNSQSDPLLEPYLPSLERARTGGLSLRARVWYRPWGADLLAVEPVEQRRMAAVTLDARVLSRVSRENDVELSEALYQDLQKTLVANPPAEPSGMVAGSHRVLVEDRGPGYCSMCQMRRGQELCRRCGGSGQVWLVDSRKWVRCPGCVGGFVTCTTCGGSARTWRGRVRFVEDHLSSLRYTYVPSMTAEIESALDPALRVPEGEDLPACLRLDLHASQEAGEPTFQGHHFGDSLQRARSAVAGLSGDGQPLRQDVKVYARPILWLRYEIWGARRDAVLGVRANGEAFAFVAG